MKEYKIKIKFLSDTLVGSSEGYGALIDSDVIFDETGLPYIPGKRVKGILRDAAQDLKEMFLNANINKEINIDNIFGKAGKTNNEDNFFISNLYLEKYEENKKYLESSNLSKDNIMDYFTNIRHQTSIDEVKETTKDNSLRTIRVLNKDLEFFGEVSFPKDYEEIMGFICKATKKMGTKRNRGFGKIEVDILDNNKSVIKKFEEVKL